MIQEEIVWSTEAGHVHSIMTHTNWGKLTNAYLRAVLLNRRVEEDFQRVAELFSKQYKLSLNGKIIGYFCNKK